MIPITDDDLMTYLDGEMTAEDVERLEDALVHDAEVRARLATLRSIRMAAAQAFAPAELSAGLAAFAESLDADSPLPDRPGARLRAAPKSRPLGAPREWLAAAAAAAITFGTMTALSPGPAGPAPGSLLAAAGDRIVAVAILEHALQSQAAGDRHTSEVRIVTSFIASNGDPCRQFGLLGDQRAGGLACFSNGAWQVEVLASLTPEGVFLPAGLGQDPIAAAAVRLGVRREIGPDEEADLIRREWRAAPAPD